MTCLAKFREYINELQMFVQKPLSRKAGNTIFWVASVRNELGDVRLQCTKRRQWEGDLSTEKCRKKNFSHESGFCQIIWSVGINILHVTA